MNKELSYFIKKNEIADKIFASPDFDVINEKNKSLSEHRLRYYVHYNSNTITDEELDEIETKINFDEHYEVEFSGAIQNEG